MTADNSPATPQATRGQIFSWALFDFAHTSFYVIILTVGYPLYFKEIVAQGSKQGDFLWGLAFSISMTLVALMSPVLGAAADYGAGKKRFLGIFTGLCVLATACLFFIQSSMVVTGIFLLILANIGFEAGMVFYDAFLPEITSERSYGRVSGYGFALGYTGSLITLSLAYPLYANGFSVENLLNVRYSFLLAAGLLFLFALPLFIFLPDRQRTASLKLNFFKIGFQRLVATYHEFPRYKNIARFLLSYFIYVDGINTIIVFSSIFARETLHFDLAEIIIFFAIVQTSAIIGSVLFGILSDHWGHKPTLTVTLCIWLAIVIAAFFIQSKWMFYVLGIFSGISLGSSQSTSRSLMSELTPLEKRTEFFGFYSFFGKASAIMGPFLFGVVSSFFNQRFAILSVGIFLLIGLVLLQRVKVVRAISAPEKI